MSQKSLNVFYIAVTILEMGFMTSQNDDLKMNDAEFQKTMVQLALEIPIIR